MVEINQQLLDMIDEIVSVLAHKYKFGYYDAEDIKQEGRILALECLPRYDGKRPLNKFLFCHIKNRLGNLKRNKFTRTDCPCKICFNAKAERQNETTHKDGRFCQVYLKWIERNGNKKGLAAAGSSVADNQTYVENPGARMDDSLLKQEIDKSLDHHLRADYLRMLDGQNLPKYRRDKVRKAVAEIVSRLDGDFLAE